MTQETKLAMAFSHAIRLGKEARRRDEKRRDKRAPQKQAPKRVRRQAR